MRVKLTLSYDGTDFCGWQVQNNGRTVQEEIEKAIKTVTGETVRVTGSGRTDAGVHAAGQTAHFDTASTIPAENFFMALNTVLPKDVRILKSEIAPDGFDANRTAKRKTYVYSLYISDVTLPLKERYAVRVSSVDIDALNKSARLIEGEHDFKAFSATGSSVKTTVRTVYSVEVKKTDEDVKIYVTGNGFLYNMVRFIVGSMFAFEGGKLDEQGLKDMLSGGKRQSFVSPFPAKGLTLFGVNYD